MEAVQIFGAVFAPLHVQVPLLAANFAKIALANARSIDFIIVRVLVDVET